MVSELSKVYPHLYPTIPTFCHIHRAMLWSVRKKTLGGAGTHAGHTGHTGHTVL